MHTATRPDLCWCQSSLHYPSAHDREQVQEIIDRFGPYINIKVEGGKIYHVQRHYIALHGIRGKDLGALGFEEISHA